MRTIHQLTCLLKIVKATMKPPNTSCNPLQIQAGACLTASLWLQEDTHGREVIGLVGVALRHLSGVSEWSKLEISCGIVLFYSLCVCMHVPMGTH